MYRSRTALLALPLAFAGLVSASGCDALAEAAGLDEVEVSTGSAGRLQLVPGQTITEAADVDISADLPDGFTVDEISIPERSLSYTPAAGKTAAACNVAVAMSIDGELAASGAVSLDEAQEPVIRDYAFDLADSYDEEAVSDALLSGQFSLAIAAANPGDCAGVLRIAELQFGLDF